MSEEIDYMDYSYDYEVNNVYSSDGTITYHVIPKSEVPDWNTLGDEDVTYIGRPSQPPVHNFSWPPPHIAREEPMSGIELRTLEPPKRAEQLLLLLLTKEERENIIGDLAEEFICIQAKHGMRFAKVWYWKQVADSAWPLLKKATRWGLVSTIGEWVRRLI